MFLRGMSAILLIPLVLGVLLHGILIGRVPHRRWSIPNLLLFARLAGRLVAAAVGRNRWNVCRHEQPPVSTVHPERTNGAVVAPTKPQAASSFSGVIGRSRTHLPVA